MAAIGDPRNRIVIGLPVVEEGSIGNANGVADHSRATNLSVFWTDFGSAAISLTYLDGEPHPVVLTGEEGRGLSKCHGQNGFGVHDAPRHHLCALIRIQYCQAR